MNSPEKTAGPFRLALVLFLICGLSAAGMAFVHVATEQRIRQASNRRMTENFRLLAGDFDNDIASTRKDLPDGTRIYTARKNGRITSYLAVASVGSGYAGQIDGMLSFTSDGKVTGYLVTKHGETPGLGGNVCGRHEEKTILSLFRKTPEKRIPPNSFLDQFNGHSRTEKDRWGTRWTLKKYGGNVRHISGATITSRAAAELAEKAAGNVIEFLKTQEK